MTGNKIFNLLGKLAAILILILFCGFLCIPPGKRPFLKDHAWFKNATVHYGLDLKGGSELLYRIDPDKIDPTRSVESVVADTINVIEHRISESNIVKEPRIQRQGTNRILIQLPGLSEDETTAMKKEIETLGNLEFRLVVSARINDKLNVDEERKRYERSKKSLRRLQLYQRRLLRKGYRWFESRDPKHSDPYLLWVRDGYDFVGKKFKKFFNTMDGDLNQVIGFELQEEFKPYFHDFTKKYTKEGLAIVFNNQVVAAPSISGPIDGTGIMVGFSPNERSQLMKVLRSGSLEIQPELLNENTIGPSLGEDAIRLGTLAGWVGLLLVIVFMIIYYLAAGCIASIALICNIIIIFAVLVLSRETLTLPGIAGILLTVGMSVDANIIIFERIREERKRRREVLSSGKKKKKQEVAPVPEKTEVNKQDLLEHIDRGYSQAFRTIFDANVTTLITAIILYFFAAGPVQGFAFTLGIGIIASFFTAIVVTKILFHLLIELGTIRQLAMMEWIRAPHFVFHRMMPKALACSLVIIVAGLVLFFSRGERNYGLDLKGGVLAQISLDKPLTTKNVRERLSKNKELLVRLDYIFELASTHITTLDAGKLSEQVLTAFSDKGHALAQDTILETIQTNQKWTVKDRDRNPLYTIVQSDSALKVYKASKSTQLEVQHIVTEDGSSDTGWFEFSVRLPNLHQDDIEIINKKLRTISSELREKNKTLKELSSRILRAESNLRDAKQERNRLIRDKRNGKNVEEEDIEQARKNVKAYRDLIEQYRQEITKEMAGVKYFLVLELREGDTTSFWELILEEDVKHQLTIVQKQERQEEQLEELSMPRNFIEGAVTGQMEDIAAKALPLIDSSKQYTLSEIHYAGKALGIDKLKAERAELVHRKNELAGVDQLRKAIETEFRSELSPPPFGELQEGSKKWRLYHHLRVYMDTPVSAIYVKKALRDDKGFRKVELGDDRYAMRIHPAEGQSPNEILQILAKHLRIAARVKLEEPAQLNKDSKVADAYFVTLKLSEPVPEANMHEVAKKCAFKDYQLFLGGKEQQDLKSFQLFVQLQDPGNAPAKYIRESIIKNFKEQTYQGQRVYLSSPFPRFTQISGVVASAQKAKAFQAIFLALACILFYIAVRFPNGMRFGMGAVAALLHDVLIAIGMIALGAFFLNVEINLAAIAALLTIVGYSLNDTIVIFDRIRENQKKNEVWDRLTKRKVSEEYDRSLNQTLARTLFTSLTTLLVLVTIFSLNYGKRSVMEGFSFILIIGVIVGTYSSIFVASSTVLAMDKKGRPD